MIIHKTKEQNDNVNCKKDTGSAYSICQRGNSVQKIVLKWNDERMSYEVVTDTPSKKDYILQPDMFGIVARE